MILGTTVSAPVYDRERSPPLFLGVAAMDFGLQSLDIALGVEEGSKETLEKLVRLSTARCPLFDVTECELEFFRSQGDAGEDAQCKKELCTEEAFEAMDEGRCSFQDDYPSNLWANLNYEDFAYEERVCCNVLEDFPSTECVSSEDEDNTDDVGAIIAGVSVGVCALCCCVGGVFIWLRLRNKDESPQHGSSAITQTQEEAPRRGSTASSALHGPSTSTVAPLPPITMIAPPIPLEAPPALPLPSPTPIATATVVAFDYPFKPTAPPSTNPNYDIENEEVRKDRWEENRL